MIIFALLIQVQIIEFGLYLLYSYKFKFLSYDYISLLIQVQIIEL
jgi:hypothetical protein